MGYEIEDSVPVPTSNAKYPFSEMGAGHSFLVPIGKDESPDKVLKRLRGACTWAQKRHSGRKFIARKVADGVRVWRTR